MKMLLAPLAIAGLLAPAMTYRPAQATPAGFEEADTVTEACLTDGKVVKEKKGLGGVTRPRVFLIECDGGVRPVVVKQLHREVRGVQRFSNGKWEMNFTDSYLYERAAYLLDRELGLNMVPVAVIRKVKRSDSAVVEWIDSASQMRDSPHQPTAIELAALAQQKSVMRLFDALIYNTDRNESNYLLDDRDWRLYLIDHSRAFRQTSDLPEGFEQTRAWLSRDLYDQLNALDGDQLIELMEGVISVGQIEKMLERRDRIIDKIDQDREEFGDEVIFSGWHGSDLDALLLARHTASAD